MFHGTIVERHGLDTALEAINQLRSRIPNIEFKVYGGGDFVDRFLKLRDQYKLNDIVHYHGSVSLETIAACIRTIDLGLIPNKRSPFTEINMPTRIFEYLCAGKPVIAPKTKGILDYFNDDEIFFFDPDSSSSLADVIFDVYSNPDKTTQRIECGINKYKKHTWQLERKNLVSAVNNLIEQ